MDPVEEVKTRLAIEDVISEYVQLKRAGRNYKGLSPFTAERTPSFVVSPEKQIWHDFSSGKGGSVFNFVMEMEGLDFRGALELLARKAGIDLTQFDRRRGGGNAKLKERLHDLLDIAAKFYQAQLKNQPEALGYLLKKRQFTIETLQVFRLGYAPDTGTALSDFLVKRGFTAEEIKQAGLSSARSSRLYDMFRGRIMVPLMDPQGSVIGFTARLLRDDPQAPKYINTPQTMLYDKSRHNFGLHLAKEAIRKSGYVVIVEGNLDVIASWQAGVRNVVATAGTAMTAANLKSLNRFTGDIRLCFDADRAGQAAAERAISVAQGIKLQLSIISIPSGKDPDELIKQDPKLWQAAIDAPQYAVDWLIERYAQSYDITSAPGKKALSDAVLAVVKKLTDKVEQEHYSKKVAELIDVSLDAVRQKLKSQAVDVPTPRANHTPVRQATKASEPKDASPLQDCLLALALAQPSLRGALGEIPSELFGRSDRRAVFEYLIAHPDEKNLKHIAEGLQEQTDYVKIITLQFEELYGDLDAAARSEEFVKTRIRFIEHHVRHQKQILISKLAEAEADGQDIQPILQQIKQLDELLKRTQ